MHEQSITDKMLRLVLAEAEAHQARRVTKINITIGALSGIVADSVEFYFQFLAKETKAAGAQLEFKVQPAVLFCTQCQVEFQKDLYDFLCPTCGAPGKLGALGHECLIESIEVE
ncbi:MAG TPA: hydrogenase maturation nickel metallochaperone HypA [Bacillota bacterium]|nr:hydrogenase maturation nickel metallochaperone HypA [Bacillota bacterium]